MPKCKIYQNLWAGYETYFVRMASNGKLDTGIKIMEQAGVWKVTLFAQFYSSDIKNDREHFPIVGEIDINCAISQAILKAIRRNDNAG